MAGSRGPAPRQRRPHDSRDARGQVVILGVGAVLVAVALIIIGGLVWSVYLPPRAHVLTVGSADFTAGDVADRARYLVTAGNGNAQTDPAGEGINSLTRQQILLEFGAGLVEPVTADDVRRTIARRLGVLVDPTPEPTPTPTPGANTATPAPTGTPTPTPTSTATPEPVLDEAKFSEAYADFLKVAPIDRDDFEGIIRAGIVEERLRDLFETELPESGDQMLISAIRTNDRAEAQALVDAVAGGQDFAEAAVAVGIAENASDVAEPGWFAPEALDERLQPFIDPLQGGQVSPIVDDENQIGFEVYYVAERTAAEPYDAAVIAQLVSMRLNEFIDQWTGTNGVVEEDLSDGEQTWIARRVQEALAQ